MLVSVFFRKKSVFSFAKMIYCSIIFRTCKEHPVKRGAVKKSKTPHGAVPRSKAVSVVLPGDAVARCGSRGRKLRQMGALRYDGWLACCCGNQFSAEDRVFSPDDLVSEHSGSEKLNLGVKFFVSTIDNLYRKDLL